MTTYRIRVTPDAFADSPREWDNLGTMACWHRRYNLGDEQPECSPNEHMYRLAAATLPDANDLPDYDDATDAQVATVLDAHYIRLPLYLYDHSGITMRTSAFSCPWGSGQVGFIYVRRGKEGMTDEALTEALQSEVATYAQYLEGDVYGFQLERAVPFTITYADGRTESDADWEPEDSCNGFYGRDLDVNGMTDHLPSEAAGALKLAFDNIDEWQEFEA